MPIVTSSNYHPPYPFRNAHINTMYPALLRRISPLPYKRVTVDTPDGDFLDLDFVHRDRSRIAVGVHGLEGDSVRPYIQGMLHQMLQRDWDVLGMNFRSCSGRTNRLPQSYNMGASNDLKFVVNYLLEQGYEEITLIGFSLGGNVVLKYLGEEGIHIPKAIKRAVAISVPCHIATANAEINHWRNRLYLWRFLKTLNAKVKEKAALFPEHIQVPKRMPRNFTEFDDQFTGPIHGYRDGMDYYTQCSSKQFLPKIQVPTLLLNALDDTFLSDECYPYEIAKKQPNLYLETPQYGGHVGFWDTAHRGGYYSERQATAFICNN